MPPSRSSRSGSKRSSWSCIDEPRATRLLDVLHGVSAAAMARGRRRSDGRLGPRGRHLVRRRCVLRARRHFLYRACGVSRGVRRRRDAASSVSAAKPSAVAAPPRAHVGCSRRLRDNAGAVAARPHRAVPTSATDRAIPVAALVYPFGFVTTVYLWAFLFSGDGRFALLGPVLLFAVLFTLRGSLGPADDDGSVCLTARGRRGAARLGSVRRVVLACAPRWAVDAHGQPHRRRGKYHRIRR